MSAANWIWRVALAGTAMCVAALAAEAQSAPNGVQQCSELTGRWDGSGSSWSSTTSSGVGVDVSLSTEIGGRFAAGNKVMNNIPAFSEADAGGAASLGLVYYWDTTPESGEPAGDDGAKGTMVIAFDRPVFNPVIHIDRVGGTDSGSSNSGYFELVTPGASLTRLAGTPHFVTDVNALYRQTGDASRGWQSSMLSASGTAAGSVLVTGEHQSLTFEITGLGLEGAGGDGYEIAVCGHAADWSDGPDSYSTLKASNGPVHQITGGISTLYLGTAPDAELDGGVSTRDASGDVDDGVVLPAIAPGAAFTIPVMVEGEGGYLQAWADWNADGDFADAGEQIAVDAQAQVTGAAGGRVDARLDAGIIALVAVAPDSLAIGETIYFRFRWSSVQGLASDGMAPDGEVEDYAVTVVGLNAALSASKTIRVFDPSSTNSVYAMPGEDVIYTLHVENRGDGVADLDTVFLVDRMPTEVEFFNGDIDQGGPDLFAGTAPVGFEDDASGLVFTYASDVGYSASASRPVSMSACNYTPRAGYDPAVTFICFNPKGRLAAGDSNPGFAVSFRARIK